MSMAPSSSAEQGWFREVSFTILAAATVVGLLTAIAMIILGPSQSPLHVQPRESSVVTSVSLAQECRPSGEALVSEIGPGSLLVTTSSPNQDTPLAELLLHQPSNSVLTPPNTDCQTPATG